MFVQQIMAPHKQPRFRPKVKTAVPYKGHPSTRRWRSVGFSTEFWEAAVSSYFNGYGRCDMLAHLRHNRLWCHRTSIYRWRMRHQFLGHYRRYRRTGNSRATVLRGTMLISLAVFRALWPRGNHHEANVWLHHAGGRVRFYQPSQISKAEDSLGMSRKRASSTARQAMLAANLQLRFNYWFLPAPYGIANVPREKLIDLDEAALFVESGNRGYGKASVMRRVREVGPYGHSEKTNVLLAICGEQHFHGRSARRWVETWSHGGTTTVKFLAFIQRILLDLGPGTPGNFYCFTMDNLNSHRNVLVQQAIHAAGHVCVFRAPYYPVDSPIEHFFNTVQLSMTLSMYRLFTSDDVKKEFLKLIRNTSTFELYFHHVGINN